MSSRGVGSSDALFGGRGNTPPSPSCPAHPAPHTLFLFLCCRVGRGSCGHSREGKGKEWRGSKALLPLPFVFQARAAFFGLLGGRRRRWRWCTQKMHAAASIDQYNLARSGKESSLWETRYLFGESVVVNIFCLSL